jgi:hypothetical protein
MLLGGRAVAMLWAAKSDRLHLRFWPILMIFGISRSESILASFHFASAQLIEAEHGQCFPCCIIC